MLRSRFVIIAAVLCIAGCPQFAGIFSGWYDTLDISGGQSVQDVSPQDISDPNGAARTSPAAGDPVRVLVRNDYDLDAECVLTMELIGQQVHFSTREVLAEGGEVVIGPDKAEIIRINGTYLGDPPIVLDEAVLTIGEDFEAGDLIEYTLPFPPEAEGACCFSDGSCELLTEEECESVEGIYQGDDTTCETSSCEASVGACCFEDGTCELLSADECSSFEGDYQGDGTSCEPNPCPQPRPAVYGACCLSDGSCDYVTEDGCADLQGVYQGDDVACDPNLCPLPTGACCFFDGSCWQVTESTCWSYEGSYQGDFTICDPNICPQPTGACCLPEGICEELTGAECEYQSGYYLGHFTVCDPNTCPQFDCPPDALFGQRALGPYDSWSILPSEDSMVGGYLALYDDFFLDGQHAIQNVSWWGLTLDPNNMIVTCEDADFRISFYTAGDGQPGEWLCSRYVTANAMPTGIYYDDVLEVYEYSATLDPNMDCGPMDSGWISIVGVGSGTCAFFWATSEDGDGYAYESLGEAMGSIPFDLGFCLEAVPAGACCLSDNVCLEVSEAECLSLDGTYQGDYAACEADTCIEPTGACCFAGGSCSEWTEVECISLGGTYQGDDTTCTPNPCTQP